MTIKKLIDQEMDRVFGVQFEEHPPIQVRQQPHHPKGAPDVVVLPTHYSRYKVEPIYFIGENKLDFLLGNIIKYFMRAEHKHSDPRTDFKKGIRYAIMKGKKVIGDPNWAKEYVSDIDECLDLEFSYGKTAT